MSSGGTVAQLAFNVVPPCPEGAIAIECKGVKEASRDSCPPVTARRIYRARREVEQGEHDPQ